jgi:glycerol kinase
MSILVVDVGTSGVRASLVHPDASVELVAHHRLLPSRPFAGAVEIDGAALGEAVVALGQAAAARAALEGVAITAQRASTLAWDRDTGEPLGPGIGWQDLRTVGQCIALRAQGIRVAPNQSATKLAYLLDRYDPMRRRSCFFGTIDTFVAWVLSKGEVHVTDATNAALTGLVVDDASSWDLERCEALRIDPAVLPKIVDSSGVVGTARALPGSPPIAALIGDQQGSLLGQACLAPGQAKATFGTGAMLDVVVGPSRPAFAVRGEAGTFPIVAWQLGQQRIWGVEAIMLSAGSCVEWLCSGLGLLEEVAESSLLAGSVPDAGGALFVPALGGMGTPVWDFGARGALVGLDATTTRAQVVRAVLEGIAHRAGDLVEAAEADTGLHLEALRVDGGMSANETFIQILADALGRPIELAGQLEATTLGAGILGGLACEMWPSLEAAAALIKPRAIIEPRRRLDRTRWLDARARALKSVPLLSTLDF